MTIITVLTIVEHSQLPTNVTAYRRRALVMLHGPQTKYLNSYERWTHQYPAVHIYIFTKGINIFLYLYTVIFKTSSRRVGFVDFTDVGSWFRWYRSVSFNSATYTHCTLFDINVIDRLIVKGVCVKLHLHVIGSISYNPFNINISFAFSSGKVLIDSLQLQEVLSSIPESASYYLVSFTIYWNHESKYEQTYLSSASSTRVTMVITPPFVISSISSISWTFSTRPLLHTQTPAGQVLYLPWHTIHQVGIQPQSLIASPVLIFKQ